MKKAQIIIVFIVSFLAMTGCKGREITSAEIKRREINGVGIEEVKPVSVDEYYEASGTVRPKTTSIISSRLMGSVVSLKVREGDRVNAGQVLLTIDDSDISQKMAAAEAGYREALKALEAAKQNMSLSDVTYRRYKKIYDEKAVSQQEMDQIGTQKKVADIEYERVQEAANRAKAGLEEAKIFYGFTKVVSPVSGIVAEKKIAQGSMAVPGAPMLTIEDTSSFSVDAAVDERFSGKFMIGMPVEISMDSIGLKKQGSISEIVPSIDPASRTFLIKAAISGSGIRSGLYARIKIPSGRKEAILVPKTAIVEKGQLTGVYAVDRKGVVSYRLVKAGKEYKAGVEILSGLSPNESVIVNGAEKAVDGGIVKQ